MLVVSPFSLRSCVMTAVFGLAVAGAASAQSSLCVQGPLPDNPDNRLVLCSPDPDSVDVQILKEGLRMTWNVPPRAQASYISPILAQRWLGADTLQAIPGVELRGTYLEVIDRRIELTVQSIDSLGTGHGNQGVVGRDHIVIAWDSKYEASSTRAIAGVFDLPPNYPDNAGLRFDVKARDPQAPPDTTTVAGVRIAFRAGTELRRLDAAFFDVEDFEGWHVWRWGADPTSPNYLAVGAASKLAPLTRPDGVWGISGDLRRITFLDRNVFEGFVYHYAITTYDQGFRRSRGGGTLGRMLDSPLELAHRNPDGSVTLGPTQIHVDFRRPPSAEFHPITAVPNPFRDSAIEPDHAETQKVFFINAPPKGTLYVFTLAGDLVFRRDHDLPTIGTIDWDTRNQSGQRVASGVYIYKIVDLVSGEQSYGRLAIIR